MNIVTEQIKKDIEQFVVNPLCCGDSSKAAVQISRMGDQLYENIPGHKRTSYGKVYAIKIMANELIEFLVSNDQNLLNIGTDLFRSGKSFKVKGVALAILACHGKKNCKQVLEYFEQAACDEDWNMREMAPMFLRQMIKDNSKLLQEYFIKLARADNPRLRRFTSETLRPVNENQWIFDEPDYSLSVLRLMFCEEDQYPRTSVGNNLSDFANRLPERILALVAELVGSGDKNAYWIAYRACRNLVKSQPVEVMDLLRVDEYTYKNRTYRRSEYQ